MKISQAVFTIEDTMPTIEAFKMIMKEECKAVVILDKNKKPYNAISLRNLKFLNIQNFGDVHLPICEFTKKYSISYLSSCHDYTTFKEVVSTMIKYKMEFIFVYLENGDLEMITVRSILKYLDAVSEHDFKNESYNQKDLKEVLKKLNQNVSNTECELEKHNHQLKTTLYQSMLLEKNKKEKKKEEKEKKEKKEKTVKIRKKDYEQ